MIILWGRGVTNTIQREIATRKKLPPSQFFKIFFLNLKLELQLKRGGGGHKIITSKLKFKENGKSYFPVHI